MEDVVSHPTGVPLNIEDLLPPVLLDGQVCRSCCVAWIVHGRCFCYHHGLVVSAVIAEAAVEIAQP